MAKKTKEISITAPNRAQNSENHLAILMKAHEKLVSIRSEKFKEWEDAKMDVIRCQEKLFGFALENRDHAAEVYSPSNTFTFRYMDKEDNVLKEVTIGMDYKEIQLKPLESSFHSQTKEEQS